MAKVKIKSLRTLAERKDPKFSKTPVAGMNIALGGSLDGGLVEGTIVQLVGQKGTLKSFCSLLCASGYLRENPDAVILFLDTEGGVPKKYFNSIGINEERVIVVDISHIDDLMVKSKAYAEHLHSEGIKFVMIVDGIGMIPSKKELEDIEKGDPKAAMARPKDMKAYFRSITLLVKQLSFPCVIVNHSAKAMDQHSVEEPTGGEGSKNSSNVIIMMQKSKSREGTEIVGHKFIMKIYKSRYIKEHSKIPIYMDFNKNLDPFTGLWDICFDDIKCIQSFKHAWYSFCDPNTGEIFNIEYEDEQGNMVTGDSFRKDAVRENKSFWRYVIANTTFKEIIKSYYCLGYTKQIEDEWEEF